LIMNRIVACSFSVFIATSATAMSTYPGQLPNGDTFSCSTCHNSPNGGGARNVFGVAAQASTAGLGVSWAEFCDDDADGDGFSNGEELGDPDCVWVVGQAPASADALSRPGDAASVPGAEGEGEGEEGEGEGEGEGEEGEGEAPVGEGEGEAPVGEGEGEAPAEGEGEAVGEGEGEGEDEPVGCNHNDNGSGNALLGGAFVVAAVLVARRRR
jgi:hypothetical protein